MIYYFSGTGNSEWVAKEIAKNTGDEAINIVEIKKDGSTAIKVKENETLGLVFPIYAWGVPEIISQFITRIQIGEGAFTYAICTCGDEAGLAMKKLSKKIRLNSLYSISMPNNYIVGFDVDPQDIIYKKIEVAKKQIIKISQDIKDKKGTYDVVEGKMAFLKSSIAYQAFNKFARNTKPFKVEDTCIGCGLCQANCPTGCITLKDNKPVWGTKCYQCLSCINRCPKHAIQYGNNTKNKGRYYMNI